MTVVVCVRAGIFVRFFQAKSRNSPGYHPKLRAYNLFALRSELNCTTAVCVGNTIRRCGNIKPKRNKTFINRVTELLSLLRCSSLFASWCSSKQPRLPQRTLGTLHLKQCRKTAQSAEIALSSMDTCVRCILKGLAKACIRRNNERAV